MFQTAIGRPMEILLIEDSLTAAKFAMGALTRSGIKHRLTWLTDGEDARQFLFQEGRFALAPQPDLVLLDLLLPRLSGREILERVRQSEGLRGVAVVIMTGEASPDVEQAFEELDVQGFLRKPVDLEAFVSLVERLKDFWKTEMILPQSDLP